MGNVIRPWQFRIRPYVKWQIENKRAMIARDEALRAARKARDEALCASREGQEELEAWRRHREKQRRPLVLPDQLDGNDDY